MKCVDVYEYGATLAILLVYCVLLQTEVAGLILLCCKEQRVKQCDFHSSYLILFMAYLMILLLAKAICSVDMFRLNECNVIIISSASSHSFPYYTHLQMCFNSIPAINFKCQFHLLPLNIYVCKIVNKHV